MNRILTATIAATAIALTPACAQEQVDVGDKAAIEEIVRAYILDNPQIIEDALIKLTEQKQLAEANHTREAITVNYAALYNNPADYTIGPDDAPVTVIEFFDYRCGFCKQTAEWVRELPEEYDGKVRVIFKEIPILSAESEKAALAAVAAGKQGKYIEMHMGLMELDNASGFGPEQIDAVAESVGVDVKLMRADMKSMPVQKTVSDAKSLARRLGITGTPYFLVGSDQVPGADTDAVEVLIDAALAKLG